MVFDGDRRTLRLRDMFGVMAFRAFQPTVFSFQGISGLAVIESLRRGVPADERKIFAIVFRMASDAIVIRTIGHERGMQPAIFIESPRDFLVTVQAFVFGASRAELVARSAVCRTPERLMSP